MNHLRCYNLNLGRRSWTFKKNLGKCLTQPWFFRSRDDIFLFVDASFDYFAKIAEPFASVTLSPDTLFVISYRTLVAFDEFTKDMALRADTHHPIRVYHGRSPSILLFFRVVLFRFAGSTRASFPFVRNFKYRGSGSFTLIRTSSLFFDWRFSCLNSGDIP